MSAARGVERPTTVVALDAGQVEYRLDRRRDSTVVLLQPRIPQRPETQPRHHRRCRPTTLVIATRKDGGVPFTHAQSLAAAIRYAQMFESKAYSHFIWFGSDWPAIAETIRAFLTADPTSTPGGRP